MNETDFLGKGLRFPLSLKNGTLLFAKGEESIEDSIRIILGTAKGERVMRPDFGCDLQELVFSLNNTSTAALAIHYVEEALKKWEPRIKLLKVDANPDTEDRRCLKIYVEYKIRTSNSKHNMVYPFYLEGGS